MKIAFFAAKQPSSDKDKQYFNHLRCEFAMQRSNAISPGINGLKPP
jgi:hypothetical protein